MIKKYTKRFKWLLAPLGLSLVLSLFRVLPRKAAFKFGKILGLLFYKVSSKNRRIAISTFQVAKPFIVSNSGSYCVDRIDNIIRNSFINLGQTSAEIAKLYLGQADDLIEKTEIRGFECYQQAVALDKGIIMITGHFGNWELLGLTVGRRFQSLHVVAKMQVSKSITTFLENFRARYGNKIIYQDGAVRRIFSVLRNKGMVGMIIDQAVKPAEGVLCDFLGRPAWTTSAPAQIAYKTGVPILPVFMHRENNNYIMEFHPHILASDDIELTTRRLNEIIENNIVEHPDEWLWIYRRWKRT